MALVLNRHSDWNASLFLDRPAFAPLRSLAEPFRAFQSWPTIADYNTILLHRGEIRSHSGVSILFEPQLSPKPRRRKEPMTLSSVYEGRIYTTGKIPTRPGNWHDFFNALVWAAFPKSKGALNARHYRAALSRLSSGSLSGARTREQDALSIVDEGGLLVLCEAPLRDEVDMAFVNADAKALQSLAQTGRALPMIIGHAIYEHLVMSQAMVRAYGVIACAPSRLPEGIDAQRALADQILASWIECDENLQTPSGRLGMPILDEVAAASLGVAAATPETP